jgi:predicted ArsR family transcriptional regulator
VVLRGLQDAETIGALEDELRRRLYLFVRARGRPVSRDEAAAAEGISRKLAAFHLDKLVDRGLLTASYARPPGRGGRGAGRSAKYYQPSAGEFEVAIPERRYDLLGSILLRAVRARVSAESSEDAARRAAGESGREIGGRERRRRSLPPPGPERTMAVATEILEDMGYEPYPVDQAGVRLRSCPFHAMAERDRDLVCGMNQRFVDGVLRGLGNDTVRAILDPVPGECCVRLEAPASTRELPATPPADG